MSDRFSLHGRVAVVTGAGRGIGKAIAVAYAEAGADLCVTARTAAEIEAVASEVESKYGVRAIAVTADQTRSEEVQEVIRATTEQLGPIDILVNNAGQPIDSPLLEMTEAEAQALIDVNLMGPIRYIKAVAPSLIERQTGSIINIASMDAVIGTPNLSVYGATKGALTAMTRSLAAEWSRHGVRINAICPGYIATSVNERFLADDRLRSAILRRIPMRRPGTPEDLSGIAVYLASDASAFVTGASFHIDGGETAV
jgi:NAD(P)-dependent dehydrogenase (short-subunit alcohol dehydrogenase family)